VTPLPQSFLVSGVSERTDSSTIQASTERHATLPRQRNTLDTDKYETISDVSKSVNWLVNMRIIVSITEQLQMCKLEYSVTFRQHIYAVLFIQVFFVSFLNDNDADTDSSD